jgi:3-oxoacyl-[acyl-carrier protein] reductase
MARGLLRAGADVLLFDIDGSAFDEALSGLDGAPGRPARFVGDVGRPGDCAAAVDQAVEAFGALHVLVNNAGRGPRHVESAPGTRSMLFWETDPDAWRAVIETNVVGVYLMTRAAAPALIATGSGRIVNVTTSLSTMQRRRNSPYGVSKAAIETETLIFAKDLEGTGVTCNSLIPGGASDTEFVSPGTREAMTRQGRRLISPEVMGPPVVWLASRRSDAVTGKRFVGKLWDPSLPEEEAAQGALEAPTLRPPPDEPG